MDGSCGAEAEGPCGPLNAGQVVECEPVRENTSLEMLSSKDFAFSTSFSFSLALFFFFSSFYFLLLTPIHTETVSNTPKKTPRNNPLKVMVVERYTFNKPIET